jgi:hypothetical protein
MKAKDYSQILKARGYRVAGSVNKYEGVDVYIKSHLYNAVICEVVKDSHGKAQEMTFTFVGGKKTPAKDIQTFKEVEGDRQYLTTEAIKIHECFEQLKQMKSPKHIYCF